MKKLALFLAVTITFFNFGFVAQAAGMGTVNVIKKVVNNHGGTKTSTDFNISFFGEDITNPGSLILFDTFAGQDTPGTSMDITPGLYNVTEVVDPGYTATYSADCSGSVADGETKTCTITNDDKPAKLTVVKHVVGGPKTAGDFTMNVFAKDITRPLSEPPVQVDAFPGSESGVITSIAAGEYYVNEEPASDYSVSYSPECNGTATLGQEITCTVTNTYNMVTLTVTKNGDGNGTVTIGSTSPTTICSLEYCNDEKEQGHYSQDFPVGTVITLTAIPDSASNFDSSWSSTPSACSGNNTVCTFTLNANTTVNAHFGLNGGVTNVISTNGGGGGSITPITPPIVTPAPVSTPAVGQVAGAFISNPVTTEAPAEPQGKVLGAATTPQLPRTGMPIVNFALVLLLVGAVLGTVKKFKITQ